MNKHDIEKVASCEDATFNNFETTRKITTQTLQRLTIISYLCMITKFFDLLALYKIPNQNPGVTLLHTMSLT